MKRIPLTQSKFALVDDEDYERVAKLHWCFDGSNRWSNAITNIKCGQKLRKISMHRYILGLTWGDNRVVDHKNQNTLDNRKENMRICTAQQNSFNRKSSKGASSRYKGVYWEKSRRKWSVGIRINNKTKRIGRFVSETAAAKAYDEWAKQTHGEFARLNLPDSELRK